MKYLLVLSLLFPSIASADPTDLDFLNFFDFFGFELEPDPEADARREEELRLRQENELRREEYGLENPGQNPNEIVFGPEFTFWVPPNVDGSVNTWPHADLEALTHYMYEHLVDNQNPESQFIFYDNDHGHMSHKEFFSPNGWQIELKVDPGVIESTSTPMTVENFEKYKEDLQDALFTSAANMGYFPSPFGGGGHVSMSLAYLKARPLLFRNFIVDQLNHGELSMGVFGFDTNNALPPAMIPKDSWTAVDTELQILDYDMLSADTVSHFAVEIDRLFSETTDPYLYYWRSKRRSNHKQPAKRNKYKALNFDVNDGGLGNRLELRFVRAQTSIDVFIRQIRLFESRIKYLETLTEPIPLKPLFEVERFNKLPNQQWPKHALEVPIDAQEALSAFYDYVTESGEKWADHQDYLWPKWIADGEVEKFNQQLKGCNTHFELSI